MLRWCSICVICNSNSFHFFIFKLGIMIVHTLKMCISHLCTFDIFSFLTSVELRHVFHLKYVGGVLFVFFMFEVLNLELR